MLHLFMAEAAATAGLLRLDLGKGDEEYKTVLGNRQLMVAEGCVERPSAVAVARRLQHAPCRYATGPGLKERWPGPGGADPPPGAPASDPAASRGRP